MTRGIRLPRPGGPFRDGAFSSPLHDERVAAILGISLGACFTICFATGLLSHLIQYPPSWFLWTSRPAGLYRLTQGLHVATGIASIPLLLAKLWVVYPKLFAWPPFEGVAHLLERVSLLPLVAGGLFLVFTGLANINLWYPWKFNFPRAHYWTAWITIGALIVHVGAKWTTTRAALDRNSPQPEGHEAAVERRQFLATVFGASALISLLTAGQTVGPLRKLALLAPRRPDTGPQGFPVNRTARTAGVVESARDASFRLEVVGKVREPLSLSLDDVRAMPQHGATLPIACVEGWSASARWGGVRIRDLLARAGAADDAEVIVVSLQQRRSYRTSDLNRWHAHDPDTMLATHVNGEELMLDHGFPLRLIGPNRPGVMQTKWVTKLVVT